MRVDSVGVDARLQKQHHDFGIALAGSVSHCVFLQLIDSTDVGALRKQGPRDFDIAAVSRSHKGRDTVDRSQVNIGTGIDHLQRHAGPIALQRDHQDCLAHAVARVHRCALRDRAFDTRLVAGAGVREKAGIERYLLRQCWGQKTQGKHRNAKVLSQHEASFDWRCGKNLARPGPKLHFLCGWTITYTRSEGLGSVDPVD